MPVELIWDGKYDSDGRKHGPLRIALPFQPVETVNESAQERQRMLGMFSSDRDNEWRNRLIWGDKKYVLPSLLPEFAGKVNMIYIDPPFATGDDFSFHVEVEGESFIKEPSIIEQKAYRDTWGRGLDSYLQWFYETAIALRELLSENGSIYVHLDYHVSHYVKAILDEIFGAENFQNEIVWKRQSAHSDAKRYGPVHDTLLFFSRSANFTWNAQYEPLSEDYIEAFFTNIDDSGRRFSRGDLTAPGPRPNLEYDWRGYSPPKGRCWAVPRAKMDEYYEAGKIFFPKSGIPRLKRYPEDSPGVPLQDMWNNVRIIHNQSTERVGYPTQKPEALLERIIKASSNEGELVLDCFCGSGTTAAVAERLNRRWITCDLGRFAIHTARKRLLGITNVRPFVVQNLGKYERQAWQADVFGPNASERIAAYTKFILDLYHAQPLTGFTWLHGIKAGRAVHVGSVDSPVTLADVKSILIEWRKSIGKTGASNTGIDVLGWEFALDMNETAKQQASEVGVDLRFLAIPREVLEKKAVEQGDVQFFELAAMFVEAKVKKRTLTLKLTNFIIPTNYVPKDIAARVTKWESWIDYWAVDFDFKGDTFHNQWQSYRTRKSNKIDTTTTHAYEQPGTYTVQVKVIDILGNDTTRTLRVDVT